MATKASVVSVVWDSCVLIDCLDHSPDAPGTTPEESVRRAARKDAARAVESQARQGRLLIVVPAIAIVELVHVDKALPVKERDERIEKYLRHKWIKRIALDSKVAHCARKIRAQGFPMWGEDAAHVATALVYKIPELLTTDGDTEKPLTDREREERRPLLALDGMISWEGGPPLRIRRPADRLAEEAAKAAEDAAAREAFHARMEPRTDPNLFGQAPLHGQSPPD